MVDFKENEQLSTLNHSCAHVMAQAIKHLYPQAKFWVGPVVSEGFYYDVDLGDQVVSDEDIAKIEKEMKKICKDGKRIVRREISKEEALEMFKDDEYKLDLISNLKDGTNYSFSIYAKSTDCSYKLLNTVYVNLPKYNKYYKDSACTGVESYNLCQRWGEIGDINYETFKSKVEEYKNKSDVSDEIKDDDLKTTSIIEILEDFWAKYYVYITIGTIVLLVPVIIIVKKKNKYDF